MTDKFWKCSCLFLVGFVWCLNLQGRMDDLPTLPQLVEIYSSSDSESESVNFNLGLDMEPLSQHDQTVYNIEFDPSDR